MLRKWCEVTSCNGVVDLLESKQSRNVCKLVFWISVMTTMVTASVWFTFRTIQCYIETPTVTKLEIVVNSTMPLPQVLICYNGGLNAHAMKLGNLPDNLVHDVQSAFASHVYASNSSLLEFDNYISKNNLSIKGFIDKFSYDCSDFISSYILLGLAPNVACKNVTTIYSQHNKCHLFPQNGYQNWPGMGAGINIQLRRPSNSYYELYPDLANEIMMNDGFSIGFEKHMGLQKSGRNVLIPLNANVEITLNVKRFIYLVNSDKCDTSPTCYNSNTCFWRCYLNDMIKVCNCATVFYWDEAFSIDGIEMCNPFIETTTCTNDALNYHDIVACQTRCKPICDEWIYETSVTYILQDNARYQNKKSIVSVAYTTMQYTTIEEVEAFTMDMAIANVGGQAGLWLGASIVTIIQALYYLFIGIANALSNFCLQLRRCDKRGLN